MLQPTELDVVLGKGRALKEAGNEGYRALIAKNRVSDVLPFVVGAEFGGRSSFFL